MKIFKFCLKYLLSHKLSVTMYLVFTLCVAITNIMSPLIVAGFLDNLIANGTVNVIIRICISFVIVNAFSILIGYMNTITYARLQTDMAYQLNRDIIHHIQNLSLSYSSQTDTAYECYAKHNWEYSDIGYPIYNNDDNKPYNIAIPYRIFYIICNYVYTE